MLEEEMQVPLKMELVMNVLHNVEVLLEIRFVSGLTLLASRFS